MASHRDQPDHWPNALAELKKKQRELTERGENRIAAGELHGETPLGRAVVGGIEIVRLPTDTNCLRISIGRPTTPLAQLVEDGAGYLRFRGALAPVRELLRDALYALERADELK